ncbi:MAG: hypothetical protein KatS3mg105_0855 [Gemmatales bacterium]|nr:MAG: hypothetical protein KatS3mg105_0855 [Gemmatales bacterium]
MILARMMAKNPNDRYQSPQQLGSTSGATCRAIPTRFRDSSAACHLHGRLAACPRHASDRSCWLRCLPSCCWRLFCCTACPAVHNGSVAPVEPWDKNQTSVPGTQVKNKDLTKGAGREPIDRPFATRTDHRTARRFVGCGTRSALVGKPPRNSCTTRRRYRLETGPEEPWNLARTGFRRR